MGTCPVCSSPVSDDFGLLECANCGAQLIVHVDGRVEYSGSEESGQTPQPEVFPPQQAGESEAVDLPPELGGEVIASEMFDGSEPGAEAEDPSVYQSAPKPDSPDLSDLEEFGNSPESGGREGPLRYNLQVSGIDTSDVREAFREAITDRKFMWDTDQILRSIRHGEVKITNVAPGKAHMLISRLRNLPVKITWEQNAIIQP